MEYFKKQPTAEGGLGIIDIKQQNKALLAKLIWCYGNQKDSLWRKVIKAKFGSHCFHLKPAENHKVSSRSPWKYILYHKDLILNNVHYKLQKGE